MTVLALLLPYRIDQLANIGVGLLTAAIIVAMNLQPDLENVFFMGILLIAPIAIVGIVWRCRSLSGQMRLHRECAASDRLVRQND